MRVSPALHKLPIELTRDTCLAGSNDNCVRNLFMHSAAAAGHIAHKNENVSVPDGCSDLPCSCAGRAGRVKSDL